MLVYARLLVLGGAIAGCGSHQGSPSPSTAKASTAPAAPSTVDSWDARSNGGASTPASSDAQQGYSFKILDPKGMVEFTDLKGGGYVAASCLVTIDFSALSASHELDFQTGAVRGFFQERAREITTCYASSPRDGSANPVKVELTVAASGTIKRANVTAKDSKLAACVADSAKKSSFPKQDGAEAVTVTYEIRFKDPGPNDCPT